VESSITVALEKVYSTGVWGTGLISNRSLGTLRYSHFNVQLLLLALPQLSANCCAFWLYKLGENTGRARRLRQRRAENVRQREREREREREALRVICDYINIGERACMWSEIWSRHMLATKVNHQLRQMLNLCRLMSISLYMVYIHLFLTRFKHHITSRDTHMKYISSS